MSSETDECNYVWNNTDWAFIPDPVLVRILLLLPVRDVLNAGECCQRWNDISKDEYLWRKLFQRDFKVDRSIPLKPGTDTICFFFVSLLFHCIVLIDFKRKKRFYRWKDVDNFSENKYFCSEHYIKCNAQGRKMSNTACIVPYAVFFIYFVVRWALHSTFIMHASKTAT